jgi:hypothetical protein
MAPMGDASEAEHAPRASHLRPPQGYRRAGLRQIKQAMGFRRFSPRGLSKVAAGWAIVCLCHNMLKLRRALGVLRLNAVAA